MMSMAAGDFDAFGLVPVIQNAPFKVTSIASYNDHIYIGTKDGRIVVYRNEPGSSELVSCKLVRGKSVDNLIIVGPLQRLIAVCGGSVHSLDLYTLQRRKDAEKQMNKKVKGCGSVFCLDKSGPPDWRLCFAVKRKLVLFEYDNLKNGDWHFMKELAVPEQCSAICMYGDSICVGYRKQYYVIKVQSGETIDVGLMLDGVQDPFIQVLPGPQFLLGGMQGMGVLVDGNADPTSGVVEWTGDVKGTAYTFPYLVSLVLKGPSEEESGSSSSSNGVGGAVQNVKGVIGGAVGGIGGIFKGSSGGSRGSHSKNHLSKMIEVHSVINQHKMVQTIQVPPDAIILVDSTNHLDESDVNDSHANRYGATASRLTSDILFASSTAVYQVQMMPFDKQVQQLLSNCEIEAAHGLLSATLSEDEDGGEREGEGGTGGGGEGGEGGERKVTREKRMEQFSLDAGLTLFLNLRFEECVSYIQKSHVDLRELLQLFPELQPITGLGLDFEPRFVRPKSAGGTLPNNVTDMMSLVRSFKKKRRNLLLQEEREAAAAGGGSGGGGGGGGGGGSGANGGGSSRSTSKRITQQGYDVNATEEEVVDTAKQCMLKIFVHRRKRIMELLEVEHKEEDGERGQSWEQSLIIIDTCIFHIYALMSSANPRTQSEKLEEFVSDPSNHLSMDDVTGVLQRQSLFHALALLNACKGRRRDALEIWMRIGNGEYVDASGREGIEETVRYLCDCGNGRRRRSGSGSVERGKGGDGGDNGNNGNNGNNGGDNGGTFEQEDANLVWRFSSWVLRKSPERGVLIFTESKREFELNPDRVLDFFLSFVGGEGDSSSSSSSSATATTNITNSSGWPRRARVAYLEYLIHRPGPVKIDQHYHTMLALELVSMTVDALEHGWRSEEVVNQEARNSAAAEDLMSRLSNPGGQGLRTTTSRRRGSSGASGKFPPIRRKLLNMLRKSKEYNNQQLLTATSGKGLHEERVLLLANAGQHEDALRTLVFELRDLNEAEHYCQEHSPNSEEDPQHTRGLFLPLIRLYLERGENNTAMTLLKRHAPRIDAIQALVQLPESATIATMQPFLQNMLRHNTHRRSQALISKNLAKTLNLSVRCKLATLESRAVVTSQTTACCCCNTLIAPNTVFYVFPAGEIAHLKCCKDGLSVHPLTRESLSLGDKELAYKWNLRG